MAAAEAKGAEVPYDAIANDYDQIKETPLIQHVERFTFLREVGDVGGKSVLDLACGTGYYSRLIAQGGAARVVGVDLSSAMIEIARQREATEPLGITYHVADVAELAPLGRFDLVTSAYLLNYAPDEATLHLMGQKIAGSLADGGEFVYLGVNPDLVLDAPGTQRYGFTIVPVRRVPDGVQARLTAHLDPPVSFEIFYLPAAAYERALRAAGLTDFTWTPTAVSPEGTAAYGADYWQDYLANPHQTTLRARRPGP